MGLNRLPEKFVINTTLLLVKDKDIIKAVPTSLHPIIFLLLEVPSTFFNHILTVSKYSICSTIDIIYIGMNKQIHKLKVQLSTKKYWLLLIYNKSNADCCCY